MGYAEADGGRGAEEAGENPGRAGGFVSGFDDVEGVDEAGVVTGTDQMEIDAAEMFIQERRGL